MNKTDGAMLHKVWSPFGYEYGLHPKWSPFERYYIRIMGLVDLPSRLRARMVLREIFKQGGQHFLDLGSGTGTYSFRLSREPSRKVCGIDINTSRIKDSSLIAERLGRSNVIFIPGAEDSILSKVRPDSVDTVLAVEVMQCFADPRETLTALNKVLKPGGCLVGHVPILGYLRPSEIFLLNDQNLPELLTQAGFEIVSITRTLGGAVRQLCRVFDKVSSHRALVAVLFPFLLLVSCLFGTASDDGDYRLFVARKPPQTVRKQLSHE